MNANFDTGLKSWTVFGYAQEPRDVLIQKVSRRLGIVPKTLDFGTTGRFFFYTAYGDVAETEQAISLKLGFARSPGKAALSAQQLLDQKIVTPQKIDSTSFRGNTLVACFSKIEAKCSVFKTIMSAPQLYYSKSGDGWIGSNNLRCLISIIDQVEFNENVLPFHFVFRHALGTMTYYKNVHRLFPGELLTWREGHLGIRCIEDLRFAEKAKTSGCIEPHALDFYQCLNDVLETYIHDVQSRGHGFGNLLSGGVDSSLLQMVISKQLAPTPARSFSYVPEKTPSFEFEVEYARQASEILKTQHTFARFTPEDYPNLIIRATEILGQPVLSDVEPCKLALAEFLAKYDHGRRFFCTALGADTLFGLEVARKIRVLEGLAQIPGARFALTAAGRLLTPFTGIGLTMLKGAKLLTHQDSAFFIEPINTIAVYADLDIVRRSFGDDAIRRVLEYRREWESKYLNTSNYMEKVHVVDLLCDTYEIQVQSSQLFLAQNKEQIYPFMDDDIIRASFTFRPETRYLRRLHTKPLLKDILEQHGLSAIARRPKGGSVFTADLFDWMRSGPLREMIQDIALPSFISKKDMEHLLEKPDHTLWSLLTLDVFQKRLGRQVI